MQRLVKLTNKNAQNRYIFAAKKQDIVPRYPKRRLFVKKCYFLHFVRFSKILSDYSLCL